MPSLRPARLRPNRLWLDAFSPLSARSSDLRCPACGGLFALDGLGTPEEDVQEQFLRCSCGRRFPVIAGVPRVLPEDFAPTLRDEQREFFARHPDCAPRAGAERRPRGSVWNGHVARHRRARLAAGSSAGGSRAGAELAGGELAAPPLPANGTPLTAFPARLRPLALRTAMRACFQAARRRPQAPAALPKLTSGLAGRPRQKCRADR